jgi:hypothetical protein
MPCADCNLNFYMPNDTKMTTMTQRRIAKQTIRPASVFSDIKRGFKRGCVRLYRALLQRQTQALDDRLFESYGVRTDGSTSLTACHSNRVQAAVAGPAKRAASLARQLL